MSPSTRGPLNRVLLERLVRLEPRGFTAVSEHGPIVWERARGSHVWDVDGRRYLDLTAAFGVATVGHCHPAVVEAVQRQARILMHAMADLHPARLKVELLQRLTSWAPAPLDAAYLGLSGADAVDAALKTAFLATGRNRVAYLAGAYHGLSLGALSVIGLSHFRRPFERRLGADDVCIPFPPTFDDTTFEPIASLLEAGDIAALIVEPIQGRGGVRPLPAGLLAATSRLCRDTDTFLIVDEIWTGLGRTGRRFALEAEAVIPDLLLVGKALGGGLPISAVVGRRDAMGRWSDAGPTLHTATFSGAPLAAAAALAVLGVIEEEGLIERAGRLGHALVATLQHDLDGAAGVADIRGRGLMVGIELRTEAGEPDPRRTARIVEDALTAGVLVLSGGADGNVLELTPPLTIAEADLETGARSVAALLRAAPPTARRR